MTLFYRAFIESVLTLSIICCYGNITIKDKKALSKIMKVGSKIVYMKFSSLNEYFNKQTLNKAINNYQNKSHHLCTEYTLLPPGL